MRTFGISYTPRRKSEITHVQSFAKCLSTQNVYVLLVHQNMAPYSGPPHISSAHVRVKNSFPHTSEFLSHICMQGCNVIYIYIYIYVL
jgi:hypothetical protein